MKKILLIVFALTAGCSANYHLRKAEKHIALAEAKGAKWKEDVKVDTIYRDTTIVVEGNSMDDTFGFVDHDTVTLTKEKIVTKLVIDCKAKTGSAKVECPDKIVKVPQKYYVNRRITRSIKTGLATWLVVGLCVFSGLLVFLICVTYYRLASRKTGTRPPTP